MKLRTIPTKYLTQRLSSTGTSLYLNNIEDWDGNDLTSSVVPTLLYAVLRNSSRTQLELIEIDGSTIADTPITITKRALGYEGGTTADTETAYDWDANDTFCELGSNPPQLLNNMVDIDRDQTITGAKSVPEPTASAHIASKAYVDAAALGSATVDQVIVAGNAGETVAAGNLVYFDDTDNEWKLCDADTASTVDNVMLGIAQGAGTNGNPISGGVLLYGLNKNQSGLTIGAPYYASNTAGGISATPGTTEVFVGFARTTTELYFDPRAAQQITENEQDALEGSSGTDVGATNTFEDWDDTSSGEDQYQTGSGSASTAGEADATTKHNKLAQSFTPDLTEFTGVALYKKADTGTFTGTVKIALQEDTAGSPSGVDLASLTISNANWLAIPVGEFGASMDWTSLDLDTLYWIVITTSTADNSNHPNLAHNAAGGLTGGSVKFWNTTDGWTAVTTIDLYIRTFTNTPQKLMRATRTGFSPAPQPYLADVGTTDAYSVTFMGKETYTTGMSFVFKATTANTGAATLAVNNLGAKALTHIDTSALITGDILAGQIVQVVYDGTRFLMLSEAASLVKGGTTTLHKHPLETLPDLTDSYFFVGNINDGLTETVTGTGTITRLLLQTYFDTGETDSTILQSAGLGTTATGNTIKLETHDIEFTVTARTSGSGNRNIFLGIEDASFGTTVPTGAAATGDHIGFIIHDTAVYASSADGTTQEKSADLSGTYPSTNNNIYRIVSTAGTSVKFYINGTLVATHTTKIPTSTTVAELFMGISEDTTTSGPKLAIGNNYTIKAELV